MEKLTATNLKTALWETLNAVKNENMLCNKAVAIASQAREILRTTNTQIKIAEQSSRAIPKEVIEFSEK
jgi:hypothetical protein